jgi:hypothetical protein
VSGRLAHDWMMTNDRESDTDWAQVAARLASARNYWLGTTAANDAPHTAPIWGVVVDDRFFIYSERETVKAKNIERDPRVVVHLESTEHVVIVYGRMIDEGQPSDRPDVVHALSVKYDAAGDSQYLPSVNEDFDVLYRLQPERVLLWELSDYDGSQQRWSSSH